jgi:hypothetical protein
MLSLNLVNGMSNSLPDEFPNKWSICPDESRSFTRVGRQRDRMAANISSGEILRAAITSGYPISSTWTGAEPFPRSFSGPYTLGDSLSLVSDLIESRISLSYRFLALFTDSKVDDGICLINSETSIFYPILY